MSPVGAAVLGMGTPEDDSQVRFPEPEHWISTFEPAAMETRPFPATMCGGLAVSWSLAIVHKINYIDVQREREGREVGGGGGGKEGGRTLAFLRVTVSSASKDVLDLCTPPVSVLVATHRYLPWSSYRTLPMVNMLVTCTQKPIHCINGRNNQYTNTYCRYYCIS